MHNERSTSHHDQDAEEVVLDDGESLVQQVLAENPPEERGVRDEWNGHVGWHRKENVQLRGQRATAVENKDRDHLDGIRGKHQHSAAKALLRNNHTGSWSGMARRGQEETATGSSVIIPWWWGGLILFSVLLGFRFFRAIFRREAVTAQKEN